LLWGFERGTQLLRVTDAIFFNIHENHASLVQRKALRGPACTK
jgi:hypothetical protein